MGSTIAELANHIQGSGGMAVGAVLLVNASRAATLTPDPQRIRQIERRFGDEIRDIFEIEPLGLAAAEAEYLLNFRDADALRTRAIASRKQRDARLREKSVGRYQAGA
jgi:hypothetical protein